MKNVANILDIPTIQEEIRGKHRKFIKDFGSAIDKVMADHVLFADIVMAKLYRIALVFKEERIIDDVKIIDNGPYKKISLFKNGYATYVNISTNGEIIVLEGFTYTSEFDQNFLSLKEKIRNVNDEKFDWLDFSRKLLDYIHATIYDRKESAEAKLNGMFIFDDEKITKQRKNNTK